MRDAKIEEIQRLLTMEFIPLFHRKIGAIIRMEADIKPRCNKNQKKALLIIDHRRRITASDLGHCLDLRKGSLSTLIVALEKYQFIKRTMDPDDKRKSWLSLTPAGESYLKDLKGHHLRQLIERFEPLPSEDLDRIIGDLSNLVSHLQQL